MKELTEPDIFGPGLWFAIHMMAYHAREDKTKKEFSRFMKLVSDNLKCNTCKMHCQEYLRLNPIANYENMKSQQGDQIGCFIWSWQFHNAVNRRKNKKERSLEEALAFFGNDEQCMEDCGDHQEVKTPNVKKPFKIGIK